MACSSFQAACKCVSCESSDSQVLISTQITSAKPLNFLAGDTKPKQQGSKVEAGASTDVVSGAVAGKIPEGVKAKVGEARERVDEAQGKVEEAKRGDAPYADIIPDDVLGKIADLLSDSLGNGQL